MLFSQAPPSMPSLNSNWHSVNYSTPAITIRYTDFSDVPMSHPRLAMQSRCLSLSYLSLAWLPKGPDAPHSSSIISIAERPHSATPCHRLTLAPFMWISRLCESSAQEGVGIGRCIWSDALHTECAPASPSKGAQLEDHRGAFQCQHLKCPSVSAYLPLTR